MKTLIVYFTRTGYTRRVAERLANMLPAGLRPLVEALSPPTMPSSHKAPLPHVA
jgi:flavodoxin